MKHKSYKFQLHPTKEQTILLEKHFGCVRWTYNYFLNERKVQYQTDKKSDGYVKQCATLTGLKKLEETKWLKEVNSQSLQQALKNLDIAFGRFFKGVSSFPTFKSKRDKNSFGIPQFFSIKENMLHVPKFKQGIKLNKHREIEGTIRNCTIEKTPKGKYYVSIVCECEIQEKPKTNKTVGIDLGVKDFVVTSDGERFKNHKFFQQNQKKLKRAQQHLARKVKGSKSREKQRKKVAAIHEKIANSRKDTLHKLSYRLVNEYDVIIAEDLSVKKMLKDKVLSKQISDASWGTFLTFLSYKASWYGKTFHKINRFYPSSKTCGNCGYINQGLKLADRTWECTSCKAKIDRDLNAAQNILKEGLKEISAGTVDNTDGAIVNPSLLG